MKLRNKKTGGLANMLGEQDFIRVYTDAGWHDYDSLAELNAEWEDYQPAEPLFTKEVAQMFRLWAEIHELRVVNCNYICNGIAGFVGMKGSVGEYVAIDIPETNMSKRITVGTEYTIDELCGEEEE